jgi:hypothetical protein
MNNLARQVHNDNSSYSLFTVSEIWCATLLCYDKSK